MPWPETEMVTPKLQKTRLHSQEFVAARLAKYLRHVARASSIMSEARKTSFQLKNSSSSLHKTRLHSAPAIAHALQLQHCDEASTMKASSEDEFF